MNNDPTADACARSYPEYLLKVEEGKLPTTDGSNTELQGLSMLYIR